MRRPSRTRRILKWTGAGLSLLILVAWAISIFKVFGYIEDGCAYVFGGGGVFRFTGGRIYASEASDFLQLMDAQLRGSLGFSWPTTVYDVIGMPVWLPFVVVAIPTSWLWYRDRRSQRLPPGHCPRCGYNLTGNTSGACSECGEPKPPPATV